MPRLRTLWVVIPCMILAPLAAAGSPPAAPKRPVSNTYWGVEVVDEYQYLEKLTDPVVSRWAEGQNAYTRGWLDSRPERPAILRRVVALTHSPSPDYFSLTYQGGKLFAIKRMPPKEQSFLVVFGDGERLTGEWTIVDPNTIDPTGSTSIDFYVPSQDGRLVAVSMSAGGTEQGTVSVYEVATGRKLSDTITRVNGGTAGGDVAWTGDGKGFYYTRYPHPGERPDKDLNFYQQIYFHRLGTTAAADTYVLGKDFPRIAEIELATSGDARYVLAEVSNGDGGEYAYYLKGPDSGFRKFADFADRIIHAQMGVDDAVYLLSRRDAPRKKILRLPYETPDLARATVVVPQSEAVIRSYIPTASRVYVVQLLGGPTQLAAYHLDGRRGRTLPTGEVSTFSRLVRLEGDEILVSRQGYRTPPAYYRVSESLRRETTPLAYVSPADFSGCEVRREHAVTDDGARIPISIVMRKGTKLDGSAPLLLYAYGSYGYTLSPAFVAHRLVFIEQGGIYAVANIRGGGAYGDDWHRAANLGNKKVSIDDLAACARYLVKRKFTTPKRLAIQGGSAGGLLVFGVMVHHPEVAAAVLAHVGFGDVLRSELSPNGEFNTTEFGTVTDETQFRGMYGYSPYHHVTDGVVYPTVMATTGMNDPRVEPWHSFKMVARLQASGTPNPVLLRVSHSTGHGRGTGLSERDQQLADSYTFLFAALGVEYEQVVP